MNKKNKLEDILFLIFFVLILFGGCVFSIISSKKINYVENRTAYQIPELSFKTFLNREFQDNYEKALSDQLPLAVSMKLWEKNLAIYEKLIYYKFDSKLYNYLGKNVYLIDDYLVNEPLNLNSIKNDLDYKIENFNTYFTNLKNIDFYIYYIERETDINFEDNQKSNIYEYIKSNILNIKDISKFEINNLNEYKKYFYKTDHHWNYKGSYKAYTEIINMINNEDPVVPNRESCVNAKFSGSKARNIGATNFFKEQFCFYQFDLPKYSVSIDGQIKDEYGNKSNYYNNSVKSASYGDFYENDFSIIQFDFFDENKENLLIIGESYDNAINDLLASHFNKTYNIDLRYYLDFDLNKFIKDNEINKVLLIGNYEFFRSDVFKLTGGDFNVI